MVKKKELSSAAALLGSRGGKKSSSNMTPEERSERGRKAIAKRWENEAAKKLKK